MLLVCIVFIIVRIVSLVCSCTITLTCVSPVSLYSRCCLYVYHNSDCLFPVSLICVSPVSLYSVSAPFVFFCRMNVFHLFAIGSHFVVRSVYNSSSTSLYLLLLALFSTSSTKHCTVPYLCKAHLSMLSVKFILVIMLSICS